MGLFILRMIVGPLMAGHGAQKLFGWFGGNGMERTAGWLESMGMRPGNIWAPMAGMAEFMGGSLTALGLFHPMGPVMMLGPMSMALGKIHWGKPIWVTSGGGELPLINIAAASALVVSGPGWFSLDRVFGIRIPWSFGLITLLATLTGIAAGLTDQLNPHEEPGLNEPERELQGGVTAPASAAAR